MQPLRQLFAVLLEELLRRQLDRRQGDFLPFELHEPFLEVGACAVVFQRLPQNHPIVLVEGNQVLVESRVIGRSQEQPVFWIQPVLFVPFET